MDAIDKKILGSLQEDARISNIALAVKVGLSPSACLRRVQALEEKGIIMGYTALYDEKALGLGSQILVMVTLTGQGYDLLQEFENSIQKIPNVLACYLMGGGYDYLIRIAVKDIEDYERLHKTHLTKLPFVASLQSNFAMREVVKRANPIL